jgi:hypothetical protein
MVPEGTPAAEPAAAHTATPLPGQLPPRRLPAAWTGLPRPQAAQPTFLQRAAAAPALQRAPAHIIYTCCLQFAPPCGNVAAFIVDVALAGA